MRIVTDQSERVAAWASARLGGKFVQPYVAIGIEDKAGKPVAATVWNNYTGENGDVHLSTAGTLAWRKDAIRYLFRYAFDTLKVNRITLRTRADDEKSVEAAIKFGFRVEGRQRQAFPDGSDALLFGMLRSECNFL